MKKIHNIPDSLGHDFLPPYPFLITIDGPAGAGKTTVGRLLADRLSYGYVDTGALYRGIAYQARNTGIRPDDDHGLERLCRDIHLSSTNNAGDLRLLLHGVDISDKIRTPEITMLASTLSARPVVRQCLLEVQRRLGIGKNIVFEGRDMGTVVFPDADVKFYLHASLKERARRRYNESTPKNSMDINKVEKEIQERDASDSSRDLAPLIAADDAIIIDSTRLSLHEVVALMLTYIKDTISV